MEKSHLKTLTYIKIAYYYCCTYCNDGDYAAAALISTNREL